MYIGRVGCVAQPARPAVAQLRAAVVVAMLAAAALDCGVDGVSGRDGGQTRDAVITACAAPTICDGTQVRACRDGQPAEVVDDCAPDRACSLGRCTSLACQQAEANVASFVGCRFYTLQVDNVSSDASSPTSVLVTNTGQGVATVELLQRQGGVWTTLTAAAAQGYQARASPFPAAPTKGPATSRGRRCSW